jgi:hypothetical protein
MVEIEEKEGHTLVCFACGLETSLSEAQATRERRLAVLRDGESEPRKGFRPVVLIIGVILGAILAVLLR